MSKVNGWLAFRRDKKTRDLEPEGWKNHPGLGQEKRQDGSIQCMNYALDRAPLIIHNGSIPLVIQESMPGIKKVSPRSSLCRLSMSLVDALDSGDDAGIRSGVHAFSVLAGDAFISGTCW